MSKEKPAAQVPIQYVMQQAKSVLSAIVNIL